MSDFFSHALELEQNGKPFVVVTMAAMRGHAPQDVGAKVIITSDGLFWGTVGGGKVEARVIADSMKLLEDAAKTPEAGAPRLVTWNLQSEIGMTCGGEVTFLFEAHLVSKWQIVIFGAGHVSQATVRALSTLNCQIICIDSRKEWVDRFPTSPKVHALCLPDPVSYLSQITGNPFFISMTRGHSTDVPILQEIFRRFPNAPYVGVIGSDVKAQKIRAELKALGVSAENIERLRCPIGLRIGTNDPAEIAISVAAELLEIRDVAPK